MQITLTPELEAMIRERVESGLYASTDDVIRDALRLLLDRERHSAVKVARLRAAIEAGDSSGPATELDFDGLLAELDEEAVRAGLP